MSARWSLNLLRSRQTVVVDDEFLFSSNSLTDVFRARSADAEHEIDNWDPGDLLNTPDSEIMDYLVG